VRVADGYLSGPLHNGRGPSSGKGGWGIPGQAVPSAGNEAPGIVACIDGGKEKFSWTATPLTDGSPTSSRSVSPLSDFAWIWNFTGTITERPLTGATLLGTDFFLLRPDGIGQVHTRERITRGDRVAASLQFMGYVVPPIPMPALSVLFRPDLSGPTSAFPCTARRS
jgi:hypothetical protein